MPKGSGIIVIPASLRSDFIHIVGMPIHIPLESTVHIAGIRIGCGCAWTALTSGVGHFSVQMVTLDQVR